MRAGQRVSSKFLRVAADGLWACAVLSVRAGGPAGAGPRGRAGRVEQQPVQAASGTGADKDGAAELVGDVVTDLKDAIRDRRLFSPRTGLSGAEAADGR